MKPLLILDIDATLIDSIPKEFSKQISHRNYDGYDHTIDLCVYKRPFADEFITKSLELFKGNVAIWTAGSAGWATFVIKKIFNRNRDDFKFVWDMTKCSNIQKQPCSHKPLSRVWKYYPEFNQHNSFLVDDTLENGYKNPKNLLLVPRYNIYLEAYNQAPENTLYRLLSEFEKVKWHQLKTVEPCIPSISKNIICDPKNPHRHSKSISNSVHINNNNNNNMKPLKNTKVKVKHEIKSVKTIKSSEKGKSKLDSSLSKGKNVVIEITPIKKDKTDKSKTDKSIRKSSSKRLKKKKEKELRSKVGGGFHNPISTSTKITKLNIHKVSHHHRPASKNRKSPKLSSSISHTINQVAAGSRKSFYLPLAKKDKKHTPKTKENIKILIGGQNIRFFEKNRGPDRRPGFLFP